MSSQISRERKQHNAKISKFEHPNSIQGITLIALIITIIILLILVSVSINVFLGKNGIFSITANAVKEHEITRVKEILEMQIDIDNTGFTRIRYMNTDEVNKLIGANSKYANKIGVYREEPVYLGEPSQEEGIYMESKGFEVINMTPDEFKYYIELGVLEDKVKKGIKIGRELQTNDFEDTITIGNNIYGIGWYLIGNYTEEEKNNNTYQNQFDELGLKDTTHAPYLVNYTTGVVLSIEGMVMYQAQITVHSFNSDLDKNLANAITYVNSYTKNTELTYGNLISTSLYKGNVDSWGGGMKNYKDNDGKLQYDENGILLLDEDNAIPVLEIDNKFQIGDNYSINITVSGDWNQKNAMVGDDYANTIVALSEGNELYLSWIGVCKGYLQVYSFYKGAAIRGINSEITRDGFASIDLSKYEGQIINIQVTAEREKETNIYINGEKVKTFKSGNNKLNFKYTTVGDLRVGRNLKFVGKLYEFGIYGIAIDEESVISNWERAKRYIE